MSSEPEKSAIPAIGPITATPKKSMSTTDKVGVMELEVKVLSSQLDMLIQTSLASQQRADLQAANQEGINNQLISLLAKFTDRVDTFSSSKAEAMEAASAKETSVYEAQRVATEANAVVEAKRVEADRRRREVGAGQRQKVAQAKADDDPYARGDTAPLAALHELLDESDGNEVTDSFERKVNQWQSGHITHMPGLDDTEEDDDISEIMFDAEASFHAGQAGGRNQQRDRAERAMRKTGGKGQLKSKSRDARTFLRTGQQQYAAGCQSFVKRKLALLKASYHEWEKGARAAQSAPGAHHFGNYHTSTALRVSIVQAEAASRLQAETQFGEGVVRVQSEAEFRPKYSMNFFQAIKFMEDCIEWDSGPGHVPCNPGKFLSPTLLELIVERVTALHGMPGLCLDLGIVVPLESPTVELIRKQQAPEFFANLMQACVPFTSREAEHNIISCILSQDKYFGFHPGQVVGPEDHPRLELLLKHRNKMMVNLSQIQPQWSQVPAADGARKHCANYGGLRKDIETGTRGILNAYFIGAPFPPTPKLPDGSPDPDVQTFRRAMMQDAYSMFVPTKEDPRIDTNFLFLLGILDRCAADFFATKKSIAKYDDVWSGKASGGNNARHRGIPMLHEQIGFGSQGSRVEAAPQGFQQPRSAPGAYAPKQKDGSGYAAIGQQLQQQRGPPPVPPKPPDIYGTGDAEQRRRERERRDLQAEARGEKVTQLYWPSNPSNKRARTSPNPLSSQRQHQSLQAMTHQVESERHDRDEAHAQYLADLDAFDYHYRRGIYASESDADEGYGTADDGYDEQESGQDDSRYRGDRYEPSSDHYHSRPHYEDPHHDVMASLSQMSIQDLPPNVVHAVDVWQRERNAHDGPPLAQQRNSAHSNAGRIFDPGVKRVAFTDRNTSTKSTAVCNEFVLKGTCKWGDRCTFSHDSKLVRDAVAKINQHQQLRDGGEGEKSSSGVATISHASPRSELSNVPVRRTNSHSADEDE